MRDMCAYRVSSFELLREDGFDTLTFVKTL